MRLATRLAICLLVYLGMLCVLLAFTGAAVGKIGIATGIGPSMPHPLTPHVGPVYWKPGNKLSRTAGRAPSAVENFIAKYGEHPVKTAHKVNCGKLEVEYMMRHGVTTPRPLKGFHGCQKASMDHNYWNPNTPTNPLTVKAATLQAAISVHNIVLPW